MTPSNITISESNARVRVSIYVLRRLFEENRAALDVVADYHSVRPVEERVFRADKAATAYNADCMEAEVVLDPDEEFWRLVNTAQCMLDEAGSLWCAQVNGPSTDPDVIATEIQLSGTPYIKKSHVTKAQRNLRKRRERQ